MDNMDSSNGDVNYDQDGANDKPQDGDQKGQFDQKTLAYLQELLKEKHVLNTTTYPHASRLMDEEVTRTRQSGRGGRDFRYVDIFREKPVKVVVKVMVPVREYPRFNFVGKLLGPKGNSLRRLQEDTLCKMSILGRNSMKDKAKEEELRKSLDPKYSHLSDDLHVEVSTIAAPGEAYGRISYALGELRKYLIPDTNDEISQDQLREMEIVTDGDDGKASRGPRGPFPRGGGGGGGGRANMRGGARGGPNGDSKTKVLSILEKARTAMDYTSNYGPNRSHFDSSRSFQDYPDHGFDGPHYEEPSGGHWKGGFKAPSATSNRIMSRPAPYNKRF